VEQLGGQPAAEQRAGDADPTRPCDLLPGISILASRPAPKPRMIHAMMPITGLLYVDELVTGLVPDRGRGLAWPRRRDTLPSGFHFPANPSRPGAETAIIRKHHHPGRSPLGCVQE